LGSALSWEGRGEWDLQIPRKFRSVATILQGLGTQKRPQCVSLTKNRKKRRRKKKRKFDFTINISYNL
jgi:hypothetical protein